MAVYGRNFVASMDLIGIVSGLFGTSVSNAVVPIKVLSETQIEMFMPPRALQGHVNVTTSNSRYQIDSRGAVQYAYVSPLFLRDVSPCRGPVEGGSLLFIGGEFPILDTTDLFCRFNTTAVSGTRISPTLAKCRAPWMDRKGYVNLEMSANGYDFSTDGLLFEYQSYSFASLRPRHGPALGGTLITISGSGITHAVCSQSLRTPQPVLHNGALLCVFDQEVVNATQQTTNTLVCRTPSQAARSSGNAWLPLRTSVHVRVHDAMHLSGLTFTYVESIVVSALSPTAGPVLGGTRVAVHGSGFLELDTSLLRCRFLAHGNVEVMDTHKVGVVVLAQYRDAHRVDCIAPKGTNATNAFVEVSQNWPAGANFSTSKVQFAYFAPPTVHSIQPQQVPVEGGTRVTIHGSGFTTLGAHFGTLRCALGRVTVPATLVSSSIILCTTPAGTRMGATPLEMSNNDQDYTQSGRQLNFVAVELSQVLPSSGPMIGGTRVTVYGSHFMKAWSTQGPQCIWGDEGGLRTPATLEAANYLTCATPTLTKARSTNVLLQTRLGNVTQASGLRFIYTGVQIIDSIHPTFGPDHGGTIVTLFGAFSQAVDSCRFTSGISASFPPVLARYISPNRVECVMPKVSHDAHVDQVAVEVSLNGIDFSTSAVSYRYVPHIKLLELQPSVGPVQGGSRITVAGTGVHALMLDPSSDRSHVACTFNSTMNVPASVSNSGYFFCKAPAAFEPGHVMVHITSNGQKISSEMRFEYNHVRLLSAMPEAGPVLGGTRVVITTAQLPVGKLACQFGYTEDSHPVLVDATTDSSSSVMCIAPPHRHVGIISLSIICAQTICGNAVAFEYYRPPRFRQHAHTLAPRGGPVLGGTRVEIYGRTFHDAAEHLACRFGSRSYVPALWLSSARFVCTSPPRDSIGVVDIWITLNGMLTTPTHFHFPSVALYSASLGLT